MTKTEAVVDVLAEYEFEPSHVCEITADNGSGEQIPCCDREAQWVMRINPLPCSHQDPCTLVCNAHVMMLSPMIRRGAICWSCHADIHPATITFSSLHD